MSRPLLDLDVENESGHYCDSYYFHTLNVKETRLNDLFVHSQQFTVFWRCFSQFFKADSPSIMKLISILECTYIRFNRQWSFAILISNNQLFFHIPFNFDCKMVSMIHELFSRRKSFLCILDNGPIFCSFISDSLLHRVASHISQKCQPIVMPFYDSEDFKELHIAHYHPCHCESVMRILRKGVLSVPLWVSHLDW